MSALSLVGEDRRGRAFYRGSAKKMHPSLGSWVPTGDVVIHPDTSVLWLSDEAGYCVVATRRIPRGTVIWVLDRLDTVITREQAAAFGAIYRAVLERYGLRLDDGGWVLCWDDARLVREAERSSLRRVGGAGMVARYDLRPGDPLTVDAPDDELGQREAELATVAARTVSQPLLAFTEDGSRSGRLAFGLCPWRF